MTETSESTREKWGSKMETLGSKRETSGSNWVKWGSTMETWGCSWGWWGSKREKWGSRKAMLGSSLGSEGCSPPENEARRQGRWESSLVTWLHLRKKIQKPII